MLADFCHLSQSIRTKTSIDLCEQCMQSELHATITRKLFTQSQQKSHIASKNVTSPVHSHASDLWARGQTESCEGTFLKQCTVTYSSMESDPGKNTITGFAQSLNLKVWEKRDKLFKALKVCENWVGSVKVREFCGLQSTRGKLSAYQSETAFPKTEQQFKQKTLPYKIKKNALPISVSHQLQ